jgi:hypothetical protein
MFFVQHGVRCGWQLVECLCEPTLKSCTIWLIVSAICAQTINFKAKSVSEVVKPKEVCFFILAY